ncbi:MAG: DEAD/DEAH box helicase [Synechococcales bacterium]|nr:DEAD/DEAH box helicase [Synechococcales bacterium]
MKILHGTWIPDATPSFIQAGAFYLWVETSEKTRRRKKATDSHPRHLLAADLQPFLADDLGIVLPQNQSKNGAIASRYFLLPTADGAPLPSVELLRYLEDDEDVAGNIDWHYWQVDCYRLSLLGNGSDSRNIISLLTDLHFMALHGLADMQLGADLFFWYHFTQAFKTILLKDQYIPALKYRQLAKSISSSSRKSPGASTSSSSSGRGTRRTGATKAQKNRQSISQSQSRSPSSFEIYPGWEIVGEQYASMIQYYAEHLPLACAAGTDTPKPQPELYEASTLLRHFSECLLTDLVTSANFPQVFEKKVADTLVQDCLHLNLKVPWVTRDGLNQYQKWQTWRDRITRSQTAAPFHVCFQIFEPAEPKDPWLIQFQVAPKHDPSLRISLLDYWRLKTNQQAELRKQFGDHFEQHLLMNLGYAARIYPNFWRGLETDQPVGIWVTLDTAFDFLKESAWVLEDAGYKVFVPAWWTPKGRQRAKMRLRAKGKSPGGDDKSKQYFSFDTLVEYQYELAVGDQPVSEEEWQQLVDAKTSLVKFRGQWMELDKDKMQQMLTFWKEQQKANPEMSLLEFMKLAASTSEDEDIEVDYERDRTLSTMLSKLHDKSQLEAIDDPHGLNGTLRGYQKRGVSWLHYLESLGLNGCLADDMGLGKTVQVIARMVQEKEQAEAAGMEAVPPTLLIAPTSVVGNWQHEIHKFAPQLTALVHHGSQRIKDAKAFKEACQSHDVVITSFTLARMDAKLLEGINWHRVVLDEAQNIKNPKTAQTKAILKLNAHHRLALTGTPVENRLLDLWSIFNFLNPGYLGKQSQFRQNFEVPIQKYNDPIKSRTLKALVEPFILRRVKTDASIIKDLPDKVEQKVYCNLTKEQASLYEATIKDVEQQLQRAEGMQRKGLILATLLKLKQICNHPMQFLQDNSEFTAERSHKLSRLLEMLEEIIEEGESTLIFTQFTELGDALEKYLRQTCHYNTYYLHGGTSRKKRERMIEAFQAPETGPSVFVLSLKAGGVGITLTRANHVFHFDRWWNPAVEDQATDRAFRIGQTKNVFVHKFVAMGTLEERIDEMIEDKKKLAGAIVGSDESWLTELDNDAFKKLIALNKTAILD